MEGWLNALDELWIKTNHYTCARPHQCNSDVHFITPFLLQRRLHTCLANVFHFICFLSTDTFPEKLITKNMEQQKRIQYFTSVPFTPEIRIAAKGDGGFSSADKQKKNRMGKGQRDICNFSSNWSRSQSWQREEPWHVYKSGFFCKVKHYDSTLRLL